jgi:hypothetical protein
MLSGQARSVRAGLGRCAAQGFGKLNGFLPLGARMEIMAFATQCWIASLRSQ